MKPLDFVRVKKGLERSCCVIALPSNGKFTISTKKKSVDPGEKNIGIVIEVGKDGQASVCWIGDTNLACAWWELKDLEVIDNLPNLLARNLANPSGGNEKRVNDYFPILDKQQ